MTNPPDAVVFLAFDRVYGLTFHLAQIALRLAQSMQDDRAELIVCAPAAEQNPGLWDALHDPPGPVRTIELADGLADCPPLIEALLTEGRRVVVHTQGYRQLAGLGKLKRAWPEQLKTVLTINSFSHRIRGKRLFKSLWMSLRCRRICDYVLFLSPYAARLFAASGGLFRAGRAGLMPLGVEPMQQLSIHAPSGPVGEPDLRRIVEGETVRLVYLANLSPGKRHAWLIDAAAEALRDCDSLRLLLPGEGPLRGALVEQVARLGLVDRVILPGRIDRHLVGWLLGRCHAGIVPSSCETFGHNYVEPMAAGLPVIGTRVGIGEMLIQDFVTGLGVGDGDSAGLERAIRWLAGHPDQARKMGQSARRLVEQNHDWSRICDGYRRLYGYLLAA